MPVPVPKRMHSSFSSHCTWELQLSSVRWVSQRQPLAQASWLNCSIKEPNKPQRVFHHCLCRAPRTQAPTSLSPQLCCGRDYQRLQTCHVSAFLLRDLHLPVRHQLVSATVVTQVKRPSLHGAFGFGPICHHPTN